MDFRPNKALQNNGEYFLATFEANYLGLSSLMTKKLACALNKNNMLNQAIQIGELMILLTKIQ
jgi:hypothetical protein